MIGYVKLAPASNCPDEERADVLKEVDSGQIDAELAARRMATARCNHQHVKVCMHRYLSIYVYIYISGNMGGQGLRTPTGAISRDRWVPFLILAVFL